MRREPEFFGGQEMDLIHIAKKLKEALRAEELLTQAGIDYAVETDTYVGGLILRGERVGAFVYVLPDCAQDARQALRNGGISPQAG